MNYHFDKPNQSAEQYKYFMRETGLFDLLANHVISNLYDYATGVEVGLDSNGRKNIGGFKFVWITDGKGWQSARKNLKETFQVLDTLYNISDLENGIFRELFNG